MFPDPYWILNCFRKGLPQGGVFRFYGEEIVNILEETTNSAEDPFKQGKDHLEWEKDDFKEIPEEFSHDSVVFVSGV